MVRALGRAVAWTVGPIIAAYTIVACVVVLSKNANLLGGILVVSTVGFFALLPGVLIIRVLFGRALCRVCDPVAEQLGFIRSQGLNGVRRLADVQALITYLWHREYLNLPDGPVRRLGSAYRIALFADMAAGAVMIGAVLVAISIAFSQLPKP